MGWRTPWAVFGIGVEMADEHAHRHNSAIDQHGIDKL